MESEYINCEKHGRVIGPECRACNTIAYIEAVEAGKIIPETLEESDEIDSKLTPLQIRFRAFQIRNYARKPYSYLGRRVVRVISTKHLEGFM